jgi:hypothetical protein
MRVLIDGRYQGRDTASSGLIYDPTLAGIARAGASTRIDHGNPGACYLGDSTSQDCGL